MSIWPYLIGSLALILFVPLVLLVAHMFKKSKSAKIDTEEVLDDFETKE